MLVTGEASDYLAEIKPVLRERCYSCHGALKQKADLRLDTAAGLLGSGVVESGELLRRLTHGDLEERMPPEGEVVEEEFLRALRVWIAEGAPVPDGEEPEAEVAAHWAYQRIERPELPVDGGNPVDAFLGERQREMGLVVQGDAERGVLLRRVYVDLLGYPADAGEVVGGESYEDVVERLLADPAYGERWGRHFMDIWRYSDWYGLGAQLRNSQKHLWRWRDWIVESLNGDKGYDRMVMEMLAGDELAPGNLEVVRGTGFLARNYYLFNRTTWLDSTIEHTSKAFLGLTMDCAKCHDH
ncbi:MAG: DUF1549 domain-containing protein [Verrucomicrobiales bacterium]|nr:DUF1549 domain-containing protein [Verrucomicrobiales bacterium]